ncbi:MAG: TatD family hydrolase [Deltaproteobacteria bacterium]|nr:TatD family hydrolase [Deltaproteobacteria bacterium]
MYLDAHCHLERGTYGDELEAVIERALQAGITHFIAVGASQIIHGAKEVIALAEKNPIIFAALGIHPHDAAKASDNDINILVKLLSHPRVVAFGEIGLDYYYTNSPKTEQRQLFMRLLKIAKTIDLPIMLHIRDAHYDACAILDDIGLPARKGVVHCFTSGPADAEAYLKRGMMLSIPGVITFKNAAPLREAIRITPLNRLLIETDCPYLAPIPYRGKRNEPAYITETAAAIGAIKNMDATSIGDITRQNAIKFFSLSI